jgi:hypothetical protein
MLPLLLSPVLGNPVSLAAVGVDGSKPLPEQVSGTDRERPAAHDMPAAPQHISV